MTDAKFSIFCEYIFLVTSEDQIFCIILRWADAYKLVHYFKDTG